MSEFHDPELRQELGRLSGAYPDENVAFTAWQRRVGQARRRRAMAWTTGAAMTAMVAVVAVGAMQGENRTVVPEEATETTVGIPTTVTTIVVSTTGKMVVTESTDESTTSTSTTIGPETTPISEDVVITMPQPETVDAGGAAPVVTTHKAKPGSGGGTATPTSASTPTTDDNASHGLDKTFTSIGGTITVRQFNDHLSIVAITPADGFHDHGPDHAGHGLGVTFTSATHRSEISVWIDNGTVKNSISEKNESHGASGPNDTTADTPDDGNHGG